jgi:hypothetical protein
MAYYEAEGKSLNELRDQDKGSKLHHLRLYADSKGTPESPAWIVSHHTSETDENPKEYEFNDGNELMGHLMNHASIPSAPGRVVRPRPEDVENVSGRGKEY